MGDWDDRTCRAEPWRWDLDVEGEGVGRWRSKERRLADAAHLCLTVCPVLDLCLSLPTEGVSGVVAGRVLNGATAGAPPCGTSAAYWRHVHRGEPTDAACRAAAADRKRERRQRAS